MIVSIGVLLAAIMVGLGLWQAQVFVDQGKNSASALASGPALTLDASVTGADVGNLWGHTVVATGHYLPDQQVVVVSDTGSRRVVTAFQLADGRVLAVARGVGTGAETPPPGELTQTGVFLPTEAQADYAVPSGTYGSVRLQALAQVWPQDLVSGYLTLTASEASAQGMSAAPVVLPTLQGKERNAGYALQWWAFAAFALVFSVIVARSYRKRGLKLSD